MICFWCQLGSILVRKIHQNRVMEASWGVLNASWGVLGRLGRILERLGALLGRLGGVLERSRGILGGLEPVLAAPGAVREPSGPLLGEARA